MGKKAKNITEENTMEYVFGYVPFFDISARGITRRTQFVAKGLSTFGPCGPWIVTKDEIPDPHNLIVRSWINGNTAQDFSTKQMAHKIPGQIAWLTRLIELQPGDVIATGTHHEGLRAINDGDVLEIEVQGIGKAKFNVKGYGPRKEIDFIPGKTPVPQFPGKVTPV
jgi:2-keto-4-pentenoate hydratase/2-oxohepta-3-ene-1,7-dioic acid hydratase in catechol pathway